MKPETRDKNVVISSTCAWYLHFLSFSGRSEIASHGGRSLFPTPASWREDERVKTEGKLERKNWTWDSK